MFNLERLLIKSNTKGGAGLLNTSINGRYEYFIADKVSAGIDMGYAFGEIGGYDFSVIHGAPFIRYYIVANKNLGVFSGFSLGVAKATISETDFWGFTQEVSANGAYYDLNLGLRFEVADKFQISTELALTTDGSLLRIGVAYML